MHEGILQHNFNIKVKLIIQVNYKNLWVSGLNPVKLARGCKGEHDLLRIEGQCHGECLGQHPHQYARFCIFCHLALSVFDV